MLKGIPEILSPELLKVLCEMGHSDRLVIADGNFPVESMGKNAITFPPMPSPHRLISTSSVWRHTVHGSPDMHPSPG